jgi:hypothetical protein
VEKTFDQVFKIANEESVFITVLIDEVETIAGSREKVATGSETSDSLRATNQLLTALDRLRYHPNVVVFCTSKFTLLVATRFGILVSWTDHISRLNKRIHYILIYNRAFRKPQGQVTSGT